MQLEHKIIHTGKTFWYKEHNTTWYTAKLSLSVQDGDREAFLVSSLATAAADRGARWRGRSLELLSQGPAVHTETEERVIPEGPLMQQNTRAIIPAGKTTKDVCSQAHMSVTQG